MNKVEQPPKEKGKKKVLTWTIDIILGTLLVFMLSVVVQMLFTKNRNFGVPRAYGLSFVYVLTDSMDGQLTDYPIASFPAGTGIVIQQTSPKDIKLGDVITFYEEITLKDGTRVPIINTHRVMDDPVREKKGITVDANGKYTFHTVGDNAASTSGTYSSAGETVPEAYLVGRVIATSGALGSFLSVVSPTASGYNDSVKGTNTSWFFPAVILLLAGGIGTVTIVNTVRDARKARKEEDAMLEAAMTEANIDRNDAVAVEKFSAKFFYKLEYREKLEKEKEKAKKTAREEIEHERKIAAIKAKKAEKLKAELKEKIKKEMAEERKKSNDEQSQN